MRRTATVGTLLLGLAGGTAGTLALKPSADQGATAALPAVPAEAIEISGADAETLRAEAANAGARNSEVTCKMGVRNDPERCHCTDGGSAGWLTKASQCKAAIYLRDGKVYAADRTVGAQAVEELVK